MLVKTKIPADVNAYKIMIRRKAGEMPATSIDGDQVYEGSNEIYYDTPPFSSQAYFYRVFTINQTGQINDKQEGATASVTLTAKEPGAVTNLAATDEKGTTTGSFDLPVVMVEGREAVNRFVTGYVVIQKEGGTPTTEADGEVIASAEIDPKVTGKTIQFTKVGQKNGANLYITVFLKNAAGSYFWSSGQVVNIVPKVLPPKPTSWSEITKLYNSSEWIAPEDGWFKIIIAGRGGNGGRSDSRWGKSTAINMGAGGGSPGCAVSEIALQQGESVRITIDGYNCSCVIKDISMQATKGGDGKTASTTAENGGDGGKSSGGNKHNYEGIRGVKSGAQEQSRDYSYTSTVYGRKGGQLNVDGYSFYGGTGGGGTLVAVEGNSNGVRVWNREVSPSGGSAPICIILRGNTNIPLDMQNARDITANALAITALAQEQTGILLGTLA